MEDASPRQQAIRTALLSTLQAAPDGLTGVEVIARMEQEAPSDDADQDGEQQDEQVATEVTRALEALEASFAIYQNGGRYCLL